MHTKTADSGLRTFGGGVGGAFCSGTARYLTLSSSSFGGTGGASLMVFRRSCAGRATVTKDEVLSLKARLCSTWGRGPCGAGFGRVVHFRELLRWS